MDASSGLLKRSSLSKGRAQETCTNLRILRACMMGFWCFDVRPPPLRRRLPRPLRPRRSARNSLSRQLVIPVLALVISILLASFVRASTRSIPPTPFASTSGSESCQNVILDGGFEQGPTNSPWLRYSSSQSALIIPDAAHTGAFGARLGTATPGNDQIGQFVRVPDNASSVRLYFWWYMHTLETDHPWDTLEVSFLPEAAGAERLLLTLDDGDAGAVWSPVKLDLAELAGEGGWLLLRSTNDELSLTTWYVDDIELLACFSIRALSDMYFPVVMAAIP